MPSMVPPMNGFGTIGPPVSYASHHDLSAGVGSVHQHYVPQNVPPVVHDTNGGSLESMMAAVNMVDPNVNAATFPAFSDNDTLAMWSTAPAGFECVFTVSRLRASC